MALRLTTAMSLVLATGLVAACNDEEVPDGTSVEQVEPGATQTPEGVEMTAETADDPGAVENQAEVADMQATAAARGRTEGVVPVEPSGEDVLVLEETVNEDAVDQNALAPDVVQPAVDAGPEVVRVDEAPAEGGLGSGIGSDVVLAEPEPINDPEVGLPREDAIPEIAGAAEALTNENAGVGGEAVLAQGAPTSAGDAMQETAGEASADLPEEVVEAERMEAQAIATDDTVLADGESYVDDSAQTGEDIVVAGDEGVVVLENQNQLTLPENDEGYAQAEGAEIEALNSTGEIDAEARAVPGSGEDVAVEETNDVGTDGIDSGSEFTMTDFDDLVLDQAGVQRLTSFIEDSDAFTATQKITIVAGIDAAKDDPQRFDQLMAQIRGILATE